MAYTTNSITVTPISANIGTYSTTMATSGTSGQYLTVGGGGGSGWIGTYHSTATGYATTSGTTTLNTSLKASTIQVSGTNPTLQTDVNSIEIDEMIGVIITLRDTLNIIPKKQKLLDSNPTLKDSFENYERILKQKLSDPALLQAYNEYRTLEILSKECSGCCKLN